MTDAVLQIESPGFDDAGAVEAPSKGTESDAPAPASATAASQFVGFNVFSGSQVLDAAGVIHHLRGGLQLSLRAASLLGITPEVIDLGGGFGIPYGAFSHGLRFRIAAGEQQLGRSRFSVGRCRPRLTSCCNREDK